MLVFLGSTNSPVLAQEKQPSFLQRYATGHLFAEQQLSTGLEQRQFHFEADTALTSIVKIRTKSPRGALWRAMFIPGWGQLYNEKYLKSALIISLESFFIIRAVDFNQQKQNSEPGDEKEALIRKRNDEVWRLLVTRLLSILDAYVDAHLYNFDESPDVGMQIKPVNGSNNLQPEITVAINW